MQSKFPLKQKSTDLGVIADPIIAIEILTKYGYQSLDFIVDTGADCSMLPKSMAAIIGINLNKARKMYFGGIEGKGVLTYISEVTIKIIGKPIKITCAFSSNEQCPFILGRKDVFAKFNILFDNENRLIQFTEI